MRPGDQTHAAVADVVRDLRPPALDDLGLVGALRAHADKLAPFRVELDARYRADEQGCQA